MNTTVSAKIETNAATARLAQTRASARPTEPGAMRAASGSEPVAAVSAPRGSDRLQLTGEAQSLATLTQKAEDTPDVDRAKVAKLRSAIADGSYRINPQSIAARLVRLDGELGN